MISTAAAPISVPSRRCVIRNTHTSSPRKLAMVISTKIRSAAPPNSVRNAASASARGCGVGERSTL
jgi:hypothetical protein